MSDRGTGTSGLAGEEPVSERATAEGGRHGLDARDREVVDQVEAALARGRELESWFRQRHRDGGFARRFDVAASLNRPDTSYGFFDEIDLDGRRLPLLGNFQEQSYDRPRHRVDGGAAAATEQARQLREFVLRYFLRIAESRDPQPAVAGEPRLPALLEPLSLFSGDRPTRHGFGYEQCYFRSAASGEIGAFPPAERRRIVDLRDVGPVYDWIVLRVRIHDFAFAYAPFGPTAPSLRLPLEETSYVVLDRRFVRDETARRVGEIGRYGFGYSFLRNAAPALVGWGPGKFEAAVQTIEFRVLADGRIRVEMAFVAERPRALAAVPLNPLLAAALALDVATGGVGRRWTDPLRRLALRLPGSRLSFDPVLPAIAAFELVTGGRAGRAFGFGRDQIDRRLILTHFVQHHAAIRGSLDTWREVADWLDEEAVPEWVRTGESA